MARSEFDREVEYLMRPIDDAGYTSLPYDKTMGSLEDQLRSGLYAAIEKMLKEGVLLSRFTLCLKTAIKETPVNFTFKVVCDAQSRQSVFLFGLQVKVGRSSEYYLFEPSRVFPNPATAFDKLMSGKLKHKNSTRVVKKETKKGRRP